MRIGSFFMILLIALVTLGYFVADSLHLRENMNNQKLEIEKMKYSLQEAEQEKQDAWIALQVAEQEKEIAEINLQTSSQNLQDCQKEVERVNQIASQLNEENSFLKAQNHFPSTLLQSNLFGISEQQALQVFSIVALGSLTFLMIGFGSIRVLGPKNWQKRFFGKKQVERAGSYVYLTTLEIKELAQRRRNGNKNTTSGLDN